MAKNDNTIFWVIGIVIIALLIVNSQAPKQEEMVGLNVHYYNDGVEVFPKKGFLGFSIVTPPGGSFDQIAFNITIYNNGEVPFTNVRANYIGVKDGNNNWVKFIYLNEQGDGNYPGVLVGDGNLDIGEKKSVVSKLISLSQFEVLNQPTKFAAGVAGVNTYDEKNWGYDGQFISIEISPDTPPIWCYQESVNGSTACGGLNTGYYSLSSYYLYATYAKPTGAIKDSLWQVKFGGRAIENITIPESCWNYNPSNLQFRFYSKGSDSIGNPASYGQCYSGSWQTITAIRTFPGGTKNSPGPGGNKFVYDGDWNTGAYCYYGNRLFYENKYSWDYYSTVYEEAMWWAIR